MTDKSSTGAPAPDPNTWLADILAKEAARLAKGDELRPGNNNALFDALATAGITTVTIHFDGYGDSGQIESIDARDAHGDVALPDDEIEIASPTHDGADVTRQKLTLADALETLAYDLLEETHDGWENNDGAYGDFTFDVAARSIILDHNSRYTAVETSTHAW